MNKSTWLITAKINLHVGDENSTSYGIIDKSVQRDALTNLPCINGSSLKGALNEYFSINKKGSIDVLKVFGVDKCDSSKDTQKGAFSFFDASLLSFPVQSNKRLFYRATSISVIQMFVEKLKIFGINTPKIDLTEFKTITKPVVFTEGETSVMVSDFEADVKTKNETIRNLEKIIGNDIVLFPDQDFIEVCSDEYLPIIARNRLEDGESQNLWYEQILPQETKFYSIMLGQDDLNLEKELNNNIIQIGANATIGMGYCEFYHLNF
jgi:CRISPR-associated protein Cmr4